MGFESVNCPPPKHGSKSKLPLNSVRFTAARCGANLDNASKGWRVFFGMTIARKLKLEKGQLIDVQFGKFTDAGKIRFQANNKGSFLVHTVQAYGHHLIFNEAMCNANNIALLERRQFQFDDLIIGDDGDGKYVTITLPQELLSA